MDVVCYEHGVVERVEPRKSRPQPVPSSLREQYPHLNDAAEDLLRVVLDMLAYERGQRGGMAATCRAADHALAKARGEGL